MAMDNTNRKRKDKGYPREKNDENIVVSKHPRIQVSSKTIKVIEERDPPSSEISLTLTNDQVNNICKYSDYLREVITLASSDEASTIIMLKEKDVNLAAQFLLILAQLDDDHAADTPLPNLSYNLGFAELASKWIVGVYVIYFQNYIKSSLIELCDENLLPVIVNSPSLTNNGVVEPIIFTSAGSLGIMYQSRSSVFTLCKNEEWRLKISKNGYEFYFPVEEDAKSLHKCSGEWRKIVHAKYDSDEGEYVIGSCEGRTGITINFKLEQLNQANESKFIDVVKCIQTHEEYRHGTIFETNPLSKVLFQHRHLRTKKIMAELMSRDELLDFFALSQGQ
jgi:hypothetical protein